MSDTKQLKPGTDGVPVQVYGQVEALDYCPTIDASDGYRVKLLPWEEVARLILGGRTIGGDGQQDIITMEALVAATTGFKANQSVNVGLDIQPLQGGSYTCAETSLLTLAGLSLAERTALKVDPKSVTINLYLVVDNALEMLNPDNDTLIAAVELNTGNFSQVSFDGLDDQGTYVAAISFRLIER